MMRPPPCLRMCGTTARVIRTIPKKFVSKIDWACSIELSSAPAGATPKPALLTSRSMRPSRCNQLRDDVDHVTVARSTFASQWPCKPSRRRCGSKASHWLQVSERSLTAQLTASAWLLDENNQPIDKDGKGCKSKQLTLGGERKRCVRIRIGSICPANKVLDLLGD